MELGSSKCNYTYCIYINDDGANIRHEKVFDNKYLNFPIERIIISKINLTKESDLIKYIKILYKYKS